MRNRCDENLRSLEGVGAPVNCDPVWRRVLGRFVALQNPEDAHTWLFENPDAIRDLVDRGFEADRAALRGDLKKLREDYERALDQVLRTTLAEHTGAAEPSGDGSAVPSAHD